MTRYEGFKFCFIFLFFFRVLFSFCSFCCGAGLPHISSYRLKRDCWIYWWGLCVCMCSWCSVLYKSKQQTTSTAWCSYLNVSFFPFLSYYFLHSVSFDWRLDIDVLVPIDGVSYISVFLLTELVTLVALSLCIAVQCSLSTIGYHCINTPYFRR